MVKIDHKNLFIVSIILLCGICYLKIPGPQPFWTAVLRALKKRTEKDPQAQK